MDQAALLAKKLSLLKKGRTILDVEQFQLNRGEVMAVIGPNGAGKSTLLKLLALLDRADSGQIFFHGQEVAWSQALAWRRKMAVVFQEPLLLNTSVYQNLALGLQIRGVPAREIRFRVENWLEKFGLSALARRHPRNLSGGEAQKVSLARALVLEPEILFLDEPFSALDPATKTGLYAEVVRVLREDRVTTLFITHDYSEIPLLSQRVSIIISGQIAQVGTPEEIFTCPATAAVAELVGVSNRHVSSVIEGGPIGQIRLGPGLILKVAEPVIPGTEIMAYFRPEAVRVFPADFPLAGSDSGGLNNNIFSGRVCSITPHGLQFKINLNCNDVLLNALVDRDLIISKKIGEQGTVQISLDPAKIHLVQSPG